MDTVTAEASKLTVSTYIGSSHLPLLLSDTSLDIRPPMSRSSTCIMILGKVIHCILACLVINDHDTLSTIDTDSAHTSTRKNIFLFLLRFTQDQHSAMDHCS